MQSIYAYQQEGSGNVASGEKQLFQSLDKLYELYISMLSFLVEIQDFAKIRIEENRQKYLPTEEDLNPNLRFVENKLLAQIASNRDYQRLFSTFKINWGEEEEMIRKFYNQLRANEEFITYMKKDSVNYIDEKYVVQKVLFNSMAESHLLRGYFEEKNIFWTEDFDVALMMVDKTLQQYKENNNEFTPLPKLFKHDNILGDNEDVDFVKILYRKTLIRSTELNTVISERAANWELDRIAMMDIIILKMAITELLEFPSIPIKVTLNEYIELAKEYSSAKSKVFINGVLDKLITDYKQQGLIYKSGRGLME